MIKLGRHSNANKSIAIFGVTGFLGRYVVNALGKQGWTVHIACRGDDMEWRHLKPLCDHGKLVPHYYNAKDQASVEAAIPAGKVDVVLNLIGKHYETKHYLPWIINNTFEDTHVKATSAIAKAARRNGVKHFVQMSCAKASLDSPSVWAKTKAQGELEAQREFPGATIVRSGQLYGPEDRFLNRIATLCKRSPVLRLLDEGKATVRPVHVVNVAEALTPILSDWNEFSGETFHLLGDNQYSIKQIVDFVDQAVGMPERRLFVTYDKSSPLAQGYAKILNLLPNPIMTPDGLEQWTLNDRDISKNEKSWDAINITPYAFETKAYSVLVKFRKGGHFRELRILKEQAEQGPEHVSHQLGHVSVKRLG